MKLQVGSKQDWQSQVLVFRGLSWVEYQTSVESRVDFDQSYPMKRLLSSGEQVTQLIITS
jgi:hypothetical protein